MARPNPGRDLQQEGIAVALLRDQLAALGQGDDPEVFEISIESETSFKDLIEELLAEDDEAAEDIEKMARRIDRLNTRKGRYKKRRETIRSLIALGMEAAQMRSLATAAGTVSTSAVPPKVIITDESAIPSQYFKRPDPVLDMKALNDAAKARVKALAEAAKLEAAAREEAMARVAQEFPEVPGITLSNGGSTISVRRG